LNGKRRAPEQWRGLAPTSPYPKPLKRAIDATRSVATVDGDEALEQWAFGFASAIAAGAQLDHGADPLAKMTAESMHAWLRDYCHQHPTSPLSVALIRLVFSDRR
jgi:hypothetical protein